MDEAVLLPPSPTTPSEPGSRPSISQRIQKLGRRFETPEMERLYQQYFLNFNKGSLQAGLAYLVLLCAVVIGLSYLAGNWAGMALVAVVVVLLSCLTALSVTTPKVRMLSVAAVLAFVASVSIEVAAMWATEPVGAPSTGVWVTAFLVFVVYTLLPIQLVWSIAGGSLLTVLAVALKFKHVRFVDHWREVSAWPYSNATGTCFAADCQCDHSVAGQYDRTVHLLPDRDGATQSVPGNTHVASRPGCEFSAKTRSRSVSPRHGHP